MHRRNNHKINEIMKILHTSDWHLGHQLYGYDRTEEQTAMLEQMARIAETEKPDVFLISGDVFHVSAPGADVQRRFVDAMLAIRRANPGMRIIVTAGNHDSASRHEIFRTPWKELGVDSVGELNKDNPEEHILEIPGKGWVVAVPYANRRNIPDGFFKDLLAMTRERNTDNLPVVMSAHTTVKGADFMGHDRLGGEKEDDDFMIGGIDAIRIEEMGDGYDYLALGHIHREQFIHSGINGAHHNARYSGSPLPVSFDEPFVHSVTIVEIAEHGGKVATRLVPIENPRPLVTLPAERKAAWKEALELLRDYDQEPNAYIRLNVRQSDPLPSGAFDTARKWAEAKKLRFCHVNYERERNVEADARHVALTVGELQDINPQSIAELYLQKLGVIFTDEMAEMMGQAIRRCQERKANLNS